MPLDAPLSWTIGVDLPAEDVVWVEVCPVRLAAVVLVLVALVVVEASTGAAVKLFAAGALPYVVVAAAGSVGAAPAPVRMG